jgi:mannose-6-phosphate isomerase-like protein (cupin superfamily)
MVEEVRNALAAMDEIDAPWQPHRLTSINDYDVKLAKFDGEFVWHTHPDTDEFFLVLAGSITIRMRDRDVELGPHDVFVVPRGVEHCPTAAAEASVLMFEPRTTVNTGDAGGGRTQRVRELP